MIQKINKSSFETPLTTAQDRWNDLWVRSRNALPTARFECVKRFASAFGTGEIRQVQAMQGNCLAAALALVPGQRWKVVSGSCLPHNPWIQAGDLLADESMATTDTYKQLAEQVVKLPGSLVTLEWTFATSPIQQLVDALQRQGCVVVREPQFTTAFVEITGDWESYLQERSRGLKKKTRSSLNKLRQIGNVELERHCQFRDRSHVTALLDQALAIEDLSWKSAAGTSFNTNPVVRDVYREMLVDLAFADLLDIYFLKLDNRRIAFEIGYRSPETYYPHKIGFDPEFARFSPGQLLFYLQLQEWFSLKEFRTVNNMGETSMATARWCNEIRQRYRYTIATRPVSKLLVRGASQTQWLKPALKRILGRG